MEFLPEAQRIDIGATQGASTGTTLVAWLHTINRKMKSVRTDSISYVVKPEKSPDTIPSLNDLNKVEQDCEEICIFTDWGLVNQE